MTERKPEDELIFAKTEYTAGAAGLVAAAGLAVLPESIAEPYETFSMVPALYFYFMSEIGFSRPEALAVVAAVSAVVAIDGNRRLRKSS